MASSLNNNNINDVFPNAYKFVRSFEINQIAYLYERVIYQIDSNALSILINLSISGDKQLQNDSTAAIAFVHFQLNTEGDIKRGTELINKLVPKESYPATLFKARTYLFDGPYSTKNLNTGLSYLNRTGIISQELNQKKQFDRLNKETLQTEIYMFVYEKSPEAPLFISNKDFYEKVFESIKSERSYFNEFLKSEKVNRIDLEISNKFKILIGATKLNDIAYDDINEESGNSFNKSLNPQEFIIPNIHFLTKNEREIKDTINQFIKINVDFENKISQEEILLLNETTKYLFNSKLSIYEKSIPKLALAKVRASLSRNCSLKMSWKMLSNPSEK